MSEPSLPIHTPESGETRLERCPRCGHEAASPFAECPKCGIVVAKFLKIQASRKTSPDPSPERPSSDSIPLRDILVSLLTGVPEGAAELSLLARSILLAGFALWSLALWFSSVEDGRAGWWLLHATLTPFHEAGHVIFGLFRIRLLTSLGGSLGQILMPLICMAVLLVKTRDAFGGAVALWWGGVSFMDMAPYIGDARAGVLPLLGGNTGQESPYGFHDWEFILGETGLLAYDQVFSRISHATGIIVMVAALAWMALMLRIMRRRLAE